MKSSDVVAKLFIWQGHINKNNRKSKKISNALDEPSGQQVCLINNHAENLKIIRCGFMFWLIEKRFTGTSAVDFAASLVVAVVLKLSRIHE